VANNYFQFKQFTIHQDHCAMKVTTDGCLFGAWIAKQIDSNKLAVDNILDIGTGTGLLSLMIAQQSPAKIDAIEIDKATYEQAKENVAASPWADRINIIHGDAKQLPASQQYDVIVSNPPFYENELKSGSSKKNKAHHDEGLLLDDLLAVIQRNLKPGGEFYLLLPYKRNKEIENYFAKNRLSISHKTLVKQSTGHNYFRILLSGKHSENKKQTFITTEISIRNKEEKYTSEFVALLKEYYLHL
jgi:tRNA1Val (adenine37-N6)-methyltransferase